MTDPEDMKTIAAAAGGVGAGMLALRQAWLWFSRTKVNLQVDESNLTVLTTMQAEIKRLGEQLAEERSYAQEQLRLERERCEFEIRRMGLRVTALENEIEKLRGTTP